MDRDTRTRGRPGLTAWLRRGGVVSAFALLALVAPAAASATVWQVTTTGDPASPTCPSASDCSLRGAVAAANAGSGSDTVTVPAGTYTLGSAGVIPITNGMTITGTSGAATTTVQTSAVNGIFTIASSASSVTIGGLTLTGGESPAGGAVASQAPNLTLTADVFTFDKSGTAGTSGSGAVGVSGGSPETVTVTGSTFSNDSAGSDGTGATSSGQGDGGAIDFESPGTLTVTGSVFTDDTAGGNGGTGTSSAQGGGGAIAVDGNVAAAVSASTFTDDTAGGNGGVGVSSAQGSGGAIFFDGTAAAATLNVSASTFSANRAGGNAGSGSSSGQGLGGALGIFGSGSATLVNDTLTGNAAGSGLGGGLEADATTSLLNDTLSGNAAPGGGIGGNLDVNAVTTLKNTIIAGGSGSTGSNCNTGGSGTINSSGGNLEDTTPSQCGLSAASSDKVGAGPLLGPLADNGGPTQTLALTSGSPAIDAGENSGCPATDQRGVLRPAGPACDMGAFEVATPSATTGQPSSIAPMSATLGGVARNPDLAGGSVDFQYGATTAYGATTPAQTIAPVTAGASFSAPVSGLAPHTIYHYRIVVTNAVSTAYGADQTFTTSVGPPVTTSPPSIAGSPKAGGKLSCSPGKWTNSPTSFAYQWSRDGTPIVGATSRIYTVQTGDEGLTLTCVVTASNAAGAGLAATSKGVKVPVPFVRKCPAATGRLSGQSLGLVRLGMTRAQARRAYVRSSTRGKHFEDFFCLTPIGVRVGYASPALLAPFSRTERDKELGRVVWASTSNAFYAVDGIRPGATLIAAAKVLRIGAPIQIGLNTWYLGPNGSSTAVLKVRHGIVEEIGIANATLTKGHTAQRHFMKNFT